MKKTIIVAVLLLSFASLFSADYNSKITGKWKLNKLITSKKTFDFTEKKSGTFNFTFNADGTGFIFIAEGAKKETMYFKWKVNSENKLVMIDYKTNQYKERKTRKKKNTAIDFAFFDNKLILIKAPDDNMILEKQ